MSNRWNRKANRAGRVTPAGGSGFIDYPPGRYDSDGRSNVCVFCELNELAHHVAHFVIPTMKAEHREQAEALVLRIREDADTLHQLANASRTADE